MREHSYDITVIWTGNRGEGTTGIRDFDRDNIIEADGPPPLDGTSDPAFLGDQKRWNPEQLLTAAVSQCHMLWYLGLCARAGVVVHQYVDDAVGTMLTDPTGAGKFTQVVLRPKIVVGAADQLEKAAELHAKAHDKCFIAQSVNFPVKVEPQITSR